MFNELFSSEAWAEALPVIREQFLLATWETLYVTVLSTLFSILIGLPLWAKSFIMAPSPVFPSCPMA